MATKLKVNYEFVGDSTTPVTRTESIKHGDSMLNTVINAAAATVNTKADKTYVDTELAKKANAADVTSGLATKADNTTVSALDSRVGTAETNIATQTSRIDEIASLPEGSTSGDAELIDIRVGADGKTYTSAGSAVRGQISDVKCDLSKLTKVVITKENMANPNDVESGFVWATIGDGKIVAELGRAISIRIEKGVKYSSSKFDSDFSYFTSDFDDLSKRKLLSSYSSGSTGYLIGFEAPQDGFLLITIHPEDVEGLMVVNDISLPEQFKPFGIYEKIVSADNIDAIENGLSELNENYDRISEDLVELENSIGCHRQYLDINNAVLNTLYINDNLTPVQSEVCSTFSPVQLTNGTYSVSNVYASFCWIKVNDTVIRLTEYSGLSSDFVNNGGLSHGTFSVLTGASLYITVDNNYANSAMLINDNYNFMPQTYVSGIYSQKKNFVVDINGGGDFTSFSEAIIKCGEIDNAYVKVKRGTYNLYDELILYYGVDYFDNYTVEANLGGLVLKNGITVDCEAGTVLYFNYLNGANNNVKVEFAPLNSGYGGFTLMGLTINCAGCRYAFHDERVTQSDHYVNNFKNCIFHIDNRLNDAWGAKWSALGGGLGNNGVINIENCEFIADGSDPGDIFKNATASYHNSGSDNACSRINFVGNVIRGGTFRMSHYGPSTNITYGYVHSNLLACEPYVSGEAGHTEPINVVMNAYCNQIISN